MPEKTPNRKKEKLSEQLDIAAGYNISEVYSKKYAEYTNRKMNNEENTFLLEKELSVLKTEIKDAIGKIKPELGKVEIQNLMDYLE